MTWSCDPDYCAEKREYVPDDAARPPALLAAPVTVTFVAIDDQPYGFRTVSVTAYSPGWRKITDGFTIVVQASPPKSQCQEVGVPVEASVNRTKSGAGPDVRLSVKFAAGTRG